MKKRLNKEIGSPLTMHDKKLKLSIAVVICVVPISLGFGIGLLLETNHIITLQRSGSTLEIIPIIDGNPPIECPEGYRIKPVGYWDKETHYRCLLIQQKEDCLETEIYSRNAMTCLPTNKDLSRFDCGDRYFLDSECHSKYVINESKNALDDGTRIWHDPNDGIVKLAVNALKEIDDVAKPSWDVFE